jgi:type IV pilus assembly protein PilB
MVFEEEKLKELLVDPGHVSIEDFNNAQEIAKEKEMSIDRALVEQGYIEDENLGKIIADSIGYPFANLKKANIEEISEKLLEYIPEPVAQSQKAVVFKEDVDGVLFLATNNPDSYEFVKHLEKTTGSKIEVYYATPFVIDMALRRYGGDLQKQARKVIEEIKKNPEGAEQTVVKLADLLFEHAYANTASDIHIEPLEETCIIRFRIDGTLYKVLDYPKEIHERMVSRIKILSRLRTDEKAAPQDGRFEYKVGEANIDVRVSVLPTTEGENVVMRLLMQQGKRFNIDGLGLLEDDLKKIKNNAKKPWGMILVVGPTGSGKTTTLYGVLQLLHKPTVNIMTVEDPVEYNMDGIQQSQVNQKKNVTFATGLRAIVRQDPDIIMVGEIRDEETVNMAIDAAMTGHLVLSTMHANDAATAFPRLLEMGVEPFLIASAVNVSIAQRLVKKICEHCRESYFLSDEDVEIISEDKSFVEMIKIISGKEDLKTVRFFRGKGCDLCQNTGYEGRTSIFEVLEINEDLRKLISEKSSSDAIRKKAIENGMTPMIYDGISKALLGMTTIDEIRRTTKS